MNKKTYNYPFNSILIAEFGYLGMIQGLADGNPNKMAERLTKNYNKMINAFKKTYIEYKLKLLPFQFVVFSKYSAPQRIIETIERIMKEYENPAFLIAYTTTYDQIIVQDPTIFSFSVIKKMIKEG